MMLEMLANTTTQPDALISGNWILAVIGALASAGALLLGKQQGKKEAQRTTLESPIPEVPTRKVTTPPTWSDHKALCDRVIRTESDILRIEGDLKEVHKIQTAQFQVLLTEGAARETRIGEKIDHFATTIHHRIDELIKSPTTPTPLRPRR